MPRSSRLDAPGVLHHIMIRGIERRNIFRNDKDREDFLVRLFGLFKVPGLMFDFFLKYKFQSSILLSCP